MKVQQIILAASIALLSMSCEDDTPKPEPVTHDHILVPEVETPVTDTIVPEITIIDSVANTDTITPQ